MSVVYVSIYEVADMAEKSEHKSIQTILDELSQKLCTKVEFQENEFKGKELLTKYLQVPKFYYEMAHTKVKVSDILDMINRGADINLIRKMMDSNNLNEFDLHYGSDVDYEMTEEQKVAFGRYIKSMHWINLPEKELEQKFRTICGNSDYAALTKPIDCTQKFKKWASDKCFTANNSQLLPLHYKEFYALFNSQLEFKSSESPYIMKDPPYLSELINHMKKFKINKSQLISNSGLFVEFIQTYDVVLDAIDKSNASEDLEKRLKETEHKLHEITKLLKST
jgi:hypothetical protein